MASLPANDSLHKDYKKRCIDLECTVKEKTNELLRNYLNGKIEAVE